MSYADLIASKTIEVGECLEWQGDMNHGVAPRIKTHRGDIIVAREVWASAHGPIPAGRVVYRHCCNDRCVSLEHLRCGKRGDQLRRRAEMGLMKHMQSTRAALTRAARNRTTTKYSEEQAAAVRDMATAGVPDVLIAGATDVGLAMVADIRNGRAWTEQQAAASVFSWRG